MTAEMRASRRLATITNIGLDAVAAAAEGDSEILRLENLDTDLPVPEAAILEGQRSLRADENNSWLPLIGRIELRQAVARRLLAQTRLHYDPATQIVITCGGSEGMLDALFATTDPGDEVVVTDPTYGGMINRIRLVGAVPVFAPFEIAKNGSEWKLDLQSLRDAISERTRALFIMNPSMPSGAVLDDEEWGEIARICTERNLYLIYNAAMERILFDGRAYRHPASLPGMAERTLTIGSMSKEFRMIGWKVGWVAGPVGAMQSVAKAHIYNTACPIGIAQTAAAKALADESEPLAAIAEWERRRNAIIDALSPKYRVIPAAGGWSMIFDTSGLCSSCEVASALLLERGKIAATYMRNWGQKNSERYVRLVFSNEPLERLSDIRSRFDRSFSNE